jgi:hypothetical protein
MDRWQLDLSAGTHRGDAKVMQNGGWVRKPLVELERAKGFESVQGVLVRAMRCKYMLIEAR